MHDSSLLYNAVTYLSNHNAIVSDKRSIFHHMIFRGKQVIDWLVDWLIERVSEFNDLFSDIEVHVVHKSCVIMTYALESSSSVT